MLINNIENRYKEVKEIYKSIGVDTDKAINILNNIPISIHCWQGDDVAGFENNDILSGGIQSTGNYIGKARNHVELMEDISKALSLISGKHKINLHGSYAIFEDGFVDRDKLEPKHFKKWVEFAKEKGLGLDFNPTFFSHKLAENGTLSNQNETIRKFWVNHAIKCIKIAEYFATELNQPSLLNIWIPDGFKDIPADRKTPRKILKKSLDEIINTEYDKKKVLIGVESKVFGIGLESYTVGSHEFYMNYACKNNLLVLLDNGHFHPTESVADKISSLLLFSEKLALHITRPVRWDSDHVVLYNDDIREIAKEIVSNGIEKFIIGLDFFDGSINRIGAWAIGMRNVQKALLYALLLPNESLEKLQEERKFTELMILQEEMKIFPIYDVWNYFCYINNVVADDKLFKEIDEYEKNVLIKRL